MATDKTNAPLSQQTLNSPSLPFEIIAEILLLMLVKSLLRSRCVCKSWNELISDPKFAKDQLRVSAMNPTQSTRHILSFGTVLRDYSVSSILNSSGAIATQPNCPYSGKENGFVHGSGSCHGMLCLAVDKGSPILWNPCTGEFKNLSFLESSLKSHYPEYDHFTSYFWRYGFGYDHSGDSYKVVVAVPRLGLNGFKAVAIGFDAMVHTVGTDSCRVVKGFSGYFHPFVSGSGKFVSGALNWLARRKPSFSPVIVSIDLGTETVQQLLPPCGDDEDDADLVLFLGVLKGCLCIFHNRATVCDIWLMKDYGNQESWTKLFSFPLPTQI